MILNNKHEKIKCIPGMPERESLLLLLLLLHVRVTT